MEPDRQTKPDATNVCPHCGARFRCGMEGGDKECWCASLPPLLPVPATGSADSPGASCLCPECLKAKLLPHDPG